MAYAQRSKYTDYSIQFRNASERGDHPIELIPYITDINHEFYLTSRKLKNILPFISKFFYKSIKNRQLNLDMSKNIIEMEEEVDVIGSHRFISVINKDSPTTSHTHRSFIINIVDDIFKIITLICTKKIYFLIFSDSFHVYNPDLEYSSAPGIADKYAIEYKYWKFKYLSKHDHEYIIDRFRYTKVIQFDIMYCKRKNIKLPLKFQMLETVFGTDIAGEIAKYLYVICIR